MATEEGPGEAFVGGAGIAGIGTYVVILAALLLYSLVSLWPHPTPSGKAQETPTENTPANEAATHTGEPPQPPPPTTTTGAPSGETVRPTVPITKPRSTQTLARSQQLAAGDLTLCEERALRIARRVNPNDLTDPSCVRIFGGQRIIWNETRLLLLVILAGALGSLIHVTRSFYWYIGQRNLRRSWLAMYVLLPWSGALLALVFYVVVRGGFFSPRASAIDTSPFGFCALAALVGMFSEPAVLKLREVAATLFAPPQVGKNPAPPTSGSGVGGLAGPSASLSPPVLTTVTPSQIAAGSADTAVKLTGKNFDKNATIFGEATPLAASYASADELTATVPSAMLVRAGKLTITVKNPDGGISAPQELTVT
jgi:hypothetical protein